MKFKERIGNVFVFDGGYDLDELELKDAQGTWFMFRNVLIDKDLFIGAGIVPYKDIQTAVNLMSILKDEGLV